MLEVICTLLALGPASPPAASTPAARLHTEAAPRMDPVFDDVGALRRAIDQFFVLQADMEKVRDEFSGAVHDTLARFWDGIGAVPDERWRMLFEVAVSEIAANIVEHAHPTVMNVRLSAVPDRVVAEFTDTGHDWEAPLEPAEFLVGHEPANHHFNRALRQPCLRPRQRQA